MLAVLTALLSAAAPQQPAGPAAEQPEMGRAVLGCALKPDGRVTACQILEETPAGKGFGAAALKMAPTFQIKDRAALRHGRVKIPVEFKVDAQPRLITSPVWTRRPGAAQFASYYPDAAKHRRIEGRAVLRCEVAPNGDLTRCAVEEETPAGAGFGQAAIKLSRLFRAAPRDGTGQPTAGGAVRVPITFRLGR